jgi:hypothetical protein
VPGKPQIRVKLTVDARGEIAIEVTEGNVTPIAHYRGSRIGVAMSKPSAIPN